MATKTKKPAPSGKKAPAKKAVKAPARPAVKKTVKKVDKNKAVSKAPAKPVAKKAPPKKVVPVKKAAPASAKKGIPAKPVVKAVVKKAEPAKPVAKVVAKPAATTAPPMKKTPEVAKSPAAIPEKTTKIAAPIASTPAVRETKPAVVPPNTDKKPEVKTEKKPVKKPVVSEDDLEMDETSVTRFSSAQRRAGPPPPWRPIENLHIYVPSHLDDINKQEILKHVNIRTEPLKGNTVEEKLRALYDLQLIDSRIDRIHSVRGELPLEVQDLEDEVAGLETRLQNFVSEIEQVEKDITIKKNAIKEAEALIKKYKEQQEKVRNNREFESLTKEMEFQELEIQLHKKKIKDYELQKVQKDELVISSGDKLNERKGDLSVKKKELAEIVKETEREEQILLAKSKEARKVIEDRLVQAYERIRQASRNGLAVVPIEREASAGSFIQIPPQKQMDVAARKKIIVDEHSGRILVDSELALEEQAYIASVLEKELGGK